MIKQDNVFYISSYLFIDIKILFSNLKLEHNNSKVL